MLFLAACGSRGKTADDGGVVESRAPAGTLVVPESLVVEVVESPVPPRDGLRPVAAWDVKPRAGTGEPATLTLRFDPETIDPERLTAWSQEPDGSWALLPVQIDAERGRATIRAEHYSLYAWYLLSDTDYELHYYTVRLADGAGRRHPKHGVTDSSYLRFGIVYRKFGNGAIDEATIAVVEEALRNATKVYYDLGYRVPQSWGFTCDVHVVLDVNTTGSQEPIYNAKPTQGHIHLPINVTADPVARAARDVRLRHDAAHELFHAIEDQYYSWPTMVAERWWVEAAAEYGASQVVGPGEVGELDKGFAAMALDATDDGHMYASGHFLRWLAAHHGLSLPALLENTSSSTERLVTALDQALDGQLDQRFRDFLAWMWFDSDFLSSDYAPTKGKVEAWNSAFGQPTGVPFQLRGSGRPVDPNFREIEALEVPGPYGALLWAIQPQVVAPNSHRILEVTLPDGVPPQMEVCLYRVPGGARQTGGVTPACMAPGDTRSPQVRVEEGDVVYALLVNQLMPRTVSIQVGDAIDPSATRVQPLGVGNLAVTVPDWLAPASDRQTALALTTRAAPGFTSIVALPFPGADDNQLFEQFQGLMRALQQPGMVPRHADPRTAYDTVEVLGRTVPLRRVTFAATGTWESTVRHVESNGRQSIRHRGQPWTGEIEYQALLWRDGDVGLVLIARGSPDDREVLRRILLSLSGTPGKPDPCANGRGFCDANAICTPGVDPAKPGTPAADGSHTCTCRDGYQGDGFNCTAVKPCNQAMLAEWVALIDKKYAQKVAICKADPSRPLACAYAIEGGLYDDYANSLDASDCVSYQNHNAEALRCFSECLAQASICLDQGKPAAGCTAPIDPCRAACEK